MKTGLAALAAALTVGLLTAAPAAADTCANAAFRTGPSATLPDCRAYEQISPTQKNGNDVSSFRPALLLGSNVFFGSDGAFAGAPAATLYNTYAASRGTDWATRSVDAPVFNDNSILDHSTLGYSDDGTKTVVVSERKYTSGAIEGGSNVYIRDISQPEAFTLVVASPNRTLAEQLTRLTSSAFVASTSDLSSIAFSTTDRLLPLVPTDGARYLYLWHDGELSLASRAPNGTPLAAADDQYVTSVTPPRSLHLLSSDGTRLTWRSSATSSLYQYVVGQGNTLISRYERAGQDPDEPVVGYGPSASPDGRTVVFTSSELTAPGDSGAYRWSADAPVGSRLTAIPLPDGGGIREVSEDLRYVWFTAFQELAPSSFGYRLRVLDTQTGQLQNVADFSETAALPDRLRLSPDGRRVAFETKATLTGVDNTSATCPENSSLPNRCDNIFTYDAGDPSQPLTCVSCKAGAVIRGNANLTFDTVDGRYARSFFDDGRLFFETPNSLVAADINTVNDVYEYVPGSGLKLLSPGRSSFGANFRDASADGENVLLATGQGLVPQDTDGLVDLYTARVGGGIASQQVAPASASGGCSGEDCRPAVRPQPGLTVPGTAGFTAPPTRVTPSFRYNRLSASALRSAGRSGRLSLPVKVSVGGRVSATLSGRLGGRKTVTVARASGRARKAGTVRLTLRLSKRARAVLRREGRLALRLTVRFSERDGASTRALIFTTGRTASKAKGGAR